MTLKRHDRAAGVGKLVTSRKSNEEIIHGLRRDDHDAALALYDQYIDLVNRLVWRILGADSEREDVIHDVFINVISAIDSVTHPRSLNAWVARVAVNTVRSELLSRKRRRLLRLSPEPHDSLSITEDQEQQLFIKRFYEVVRKLRPKDHVIFTLRFVAGMTIREVATLCSCSTATVKRRSEKGRKRFMVLAKNDSILSSIIEDLEHAKRD